MTDFEAWLTKGLGRAATFLKSTDSRPWREPLLYACTHNLAYDDQCEDSRARYLLDLIDISGDTDYYRVRIVEYLNLDRDLSDSALAQISEIAASFAAAGSVAARSALYAAFDRRGFTGAGSDCAGRLVILDGMSGLLSVVPKLVEVEPEERPWQFGSLIELLDKHHGKQTLPPQLDGLLQEWREYETRRDPERRKPSAPRPDYAEIKRRILEKGRSAGMAAWGKSAPDEVMARLAQDVLTETELARATDQDIARAAMAALSHSTNPAIRALAFEVADRPACRALAVKMLNRNGDSADYPLLETFLQAPVDPDVDHAIGFAVLRFVEVHREPVAACSLLLLYENTPCARCRHAAVRHLIAIHHLPRWIAEECRYDCESDTRDLAGILPDALGPSPPPIL
jgi:hypothetical protein